MEKDGDAVQDLRGGNPLPGRERGTRRPRFLPWSPLAGMLRSRWSEAGNPAERVRLFSGDAFFYVE